MKKLSFVLVVVFLISGCFLAKPAAAQEKTKEEKEMELRMQEQIDQQKKAIAGQKKAQEEASRTWVDQQKIVEESMRQAKSQIDSAFKYNDMVKIYGGGRKRPRSFEFNGEPFMFTPGEEPMFNHSLFGNDEKTTWDFSKSLKENSFSSDYTFDVEKSANTVVMSVNGDCKAGDIRIKIIMPNGKTYSDIVIDEFGNLNWRKSFSISEDENKDKAGAWKFKIDANKATGYFKISLQTY